MAKKSTTKKIIISIGIVVIILLGLLFYFGREFMLQKQYPLEYEDLILKYSHEYDLDADFVAAVISVESRYRPAVVSRAGAVGLMQIMPDTGEWIAEMLKDSEYLEDRLTDPALNIRYGCWFLDYLFKRYDGDVTLILAGYNAGIGRVSQWLEKQEYSSDGKTLENIPYKETREYVVKVNHAHEKYKDMYGLEEHKETLWLEK
jgi:soluble lytic murein transglycosylase